VQGDRNATRCSRLGVCVRPRLVHARDKTAASPTSARNPGRRFIDIGAGIRGLAHGPAVHCRDAGMQIMRQPFVISVEERQELAMTELDSVVTRSPWAAIVPTHQSYPRVSVPRSDVPAPMGRAVVDDDYLKVGKRLAGNRCQCALDILGFIEQWNNDGDARPRLTFRGNDARNNAAAWPSRTRR
jgi:hypothetical protein